MNWPPSGNGWAKLRLTRLDGIADFAAEGIEVRRADKDCWGLTIETGDPSPGDRTSFPSFENCRRVGFELVYRRSNYKRV